MWGGVECTVNRVGDRFHDQLVASGHHHRHADIDAIADLGVRVVRYPVLWERTERSPGCHDFAWPDRRLALLRARGLTPIVGLLHHGSGPPHTDLLDREFPRLLARFAGAVARRYPWVELYTPVNEPLTTARFSGLYGHWYPHHRSDASFCRALVNQCLATQAAMREIRRVQPGARLVHTEDLGAVLATPRCSTRLNSRTSAASSRTTCCAAGSTASTRCTPICAPPGSPTTSWRSCAISRRPTCSAPITTSPASASSTTASNITPTSPPAATAATATSTSRPSACATTACRGPTSCSTSSAIATGCPSRSPRPTSPATSTSRSAGSTSCGGPRSAAGPPGSTSARSLRGRCSAPTTGIAS
ncbi:family 1 glycosylhydrolase [Nannocystis pusilla]|uniref:family 1 glycosylhydrolase n=1 Tax=Nannocystis pusilla TaxID=889268 RepID=UPI003B810249